MLVEGVANADENRRAAEETQVMSFELFFDLLYGKSLFVREQWRNWRNAD
jgi:hypothetical protein